MVQSPAANDTPASPPATSTNVVPLPPRIEPERPSDRAIAFVKEHPMLVVAGGLAIGLAVSALLPRGFGRKAAGRAMRLAEAGMGTAALLGKQAADKAEDVGSDARKRASVLATQAEKLSDKALVKAEKLGIAALGTAGTLGQKAATKAEKYGHVAAERAELLGIKASDGLNRLGSAAAARSQKLLRHQKAHDRLSDRILEKASKLKARMRA